MSEGRLLNRFNSRTIVSGARTKSTQPLAMAFPGIPGYLALLLSWAKVMPPDALMASNPCVPSVPLPERITPTAFSPCSLASDRKKRSIGI